MNFSLTFQNDERQSKARSQHRNASRKYQIPMGEASLMDVSIPSFPASVECSSRVEQPLGVSVTRSASIPLPSTHIDRTISEVQLCMDKAVAEEREITMFYRVVTGIRERQQKLAANHPLPHRPMPSSRRALSAYDCYGNSQSHHAQQLFPALIPQEEDNHKVVSVDCSDQLFITGYNNNDVQEYFSCRPSMPKKQEDTGDEDYGIFDLEL
mmetsp:Transcript_1152/g.1518  ORF Transcript_1152/g.1518 Transcript_1152/m.1518 type:complete len:211 (-) Transcript_1152:31-663(-)